MGHKIFFTVLGIILFLGCIVLMGFIIISGQHPTALQILALFVALIVTHICARIAKQPWK